MGQDAQAIRAEIEATRERMGETAEAIAYRADVKTRTKERITDKGNSARSKLGLAGSQVAGAVPSGTDVREGAGRAVGIAQENPLGLAIGSLAVGFIAGLVVPTTRVENERLGPIADEIKEQVIQTGQEALEHGREVAQDAVAGAADAVQQSSEEHVEALKASAQESVEHVKDAART
jgi:Protein of unknown function (DUF3618)